MGRKLLLVLLALIAAVPAVATQASGARLDPSFGRNGKVVLPGSVDEERRYMGPIDSWPLTDGRVLIYMRDVEYRAEVVALLPSGKFDPSFGLGGSVQPLSAPDRRASLSSWTVDELGRLVLVGSSSPIDAAPGPLYGDYPSQAFVQRFTSDGLLDPSFGDGGTLTADFGLPPAEPGLGPDVDAYGAVLDQNGRIIIRGRRAAGKIYADKGSFARDHEAFLARLTSSGEVDASFANDGVLPLSGSDWAGAVFPNPEGGVLAASWRGEEGKLVRLDPSGRFDPAFGEQGGLPVPNAIKGSESMDPFALDRAGRLLLSAGLPSWGDRYRPRRLVFKRLLPDGSLDRDYGRRGLLTFRFPLLKTARVAADGKGGLLVAMALGERGPRRKSPAPTELVLARLRADGSLDRRFGRAGALPILSSGPVNFRLDHLTLQGDRKALIQFDSCKKRCRTILVRIDLRA